MTPSHEREMAVALTTEIVTLSGDVVGTVFKKIWDKMLIVSLTTSAGQWHIADFPDVGVHSDCKGVNDHDTTPRLFAIRILITPAIGMS